MKFGLPFMKSTPTQIKQLNVNEVYQLFMNPDDNLVFLDVRQPEEWREGIIPGSVKIPLGELSAHLNKLDTSKKFIIVCRSGNRSNTAAKMMEGAGFKDLSNFQGGMMAWQSRNYPVE